MKMMKKSSLLLLTFVLLFALTLAGCGPQGEQEKNQNPEPKAGVEKQGDADQEPEEQEVELTLYFSDDQAMYLVPTKEKAMVADTSTATLAKVIVEKLIAGPDKDSLQPTIPAEADLLSVKVDNKIAVLNFNQAFVDKHPGGSTGESMTIYSLTNSLTELEGIDKVAFQVEGQSIETLKGHMDLTQPVTRDTSLIKQP